MATYKQYIEIIDIPTNAAEERLAVEEWNLYGQNRLGVLNKEEIVASRIGVWNGTNFIPGDPPTYTINGAPAVNLVFDEQVGFKNYELSNHLGNVLATITDRKVPDIDVPTSTYTYFNAQITSITDYYPFGMQIEERSWTATNNKYRFGFNGKENDNEVKGDGNQQDYGMRISDTRLGKFLSVDPLTKKYPELTPYQFASNTPIGAIDVDGLEANINFNIGLNINVGNHTSNARGFVAINGNQRVLTNTKFDFTISYHFRTGGLGTDQGFTGKSTFVGELNFSGGLTAGGGQAENMKFSAFHYSSGVMLENDYAGSFSLGVNSTISSLFGKHPAANRMSLYTFGRAGSVVAGQYNDMFLDKLNIGHDSQWTGGGGIIINTGIGQFVASYDAYTGRRPDNNSTTDIWENGNSHPYFDQDFDEIKFNNGRTSISLITNNYIFSIAHMGNGLFNEQWMQNFIHDNWKVKDPVTRKKVKAPIGRFRNISRESLIFSLFRIWPTNFIGQE